MENWEDFSKEKTVNIHYLNTFSLLLEGWVCVYIVKMSQRKCLEISAIFNNNYDKNPLHRMSSLYSHS